MRRAFSTVVRAGLAGLLIATVFSRGELISVRVWLSAAAVGITASAVSRLIVAARVEPAGLITAWKPRRTRGRSFDGGIKSLRATESVMREASRNPRSFGHQLRPRLHDLARHYLPISHGIDPDVDPAAAAVVLGDVAWLIDPRPARDAPTLDEIQRFVRIVAGTRHSATRRQEVSTP
ncbi:MAG: hypothetical protein ACR2P0_03185 [Acidimicrobiales bacterium]